MSEQIEGRNAVLEAFRSGKCVDKLFILDGCQDGPVRTIAREARKKDTIINYVAKERLDQCGIRKQYENTGLEPCIEEIIKDILCNEGKEKQMLKKIGFIGVGIMGKSMVRNLMKAGYEVSIYTRTKSKVEDVIAEGAVWCDTVADCSKGRDVVITIVGYPKY